MDDLIEFAAGRIQAQEGLPEINALLAEKIASVGEAVLNARNEQFEGSAIEQFVLMLEGVPANHSLRVMVDMLDSPYGESVRDFLRTAPASNARIGYFGKLQALSELFTPARVERITETARYIEDGWGWRGV